MKNQKIPVRLNEVIMTCLEWPCDKFDQLREWLEAGGRARQARINSKKLQSPTTLPSMQTAFRTTVVEGGEKPEYSMVFRFSSLETMNQADEEWRALQAKH